MTTDIEKRTVQTPEVIKTARRIRDVSEQNGANGTMVLFQVNPALEDYDGEKFEYVIASSVHAMFSGYETLVFPSNEAGEVCDWGELIGQRGAEAAEVFADSGYELV